MASLSTEPATPANAPSLWRNRDYMLLWSGQVISTTGTGISGIAFPFLVLLLTNSPLQAGIAGALRALPYVLFSLPVGALIDRWNRKVIMILCDAGRAVALGSIPVALVFGVLTIWQIFIVAFVEGTLFVFFDIAEVACLPQRGRQTADWRPPPPRIKRRLVMATLIASPLGGFLYGLAGNVSFHCR